MKTLNNLFGKQTGTSINGFEKFAMSNSELANVLGGGSHTPDIWIPDDEDKDKN